MKKEDIHLKPLTPGEVARFTVTERAVCGGRTVVSNTTLIQNAGDYNPSVALRRQLPLLKGAFKLGLFVQ